MIATRSTRQMYDPEESLWENYKDAAATEAYDPDDQEDVGFFDWWEDHQDIRDEGSAWLEYLSELDRKPWEWD